ncbi:MAG TPA: molybdopterin-dependent oxidoreductase [Candidatus Eisenbacteria bacterium]
MATAESSITAARPSTTVCPFCGSGCSMFLHGAASYPRRGHPVSQGALCLRGWSAGELLRSPARVLSAHRRARGGPLEPVGLEVALDEVAARLGAIRDAGGGARIGILGSARVTVEEARLLSRLARALGTPHLDTLQRAGYLSLPPLPLQAIEDAARITVLAANLTVRQPQAARRLLRAVDRGARVRFVHSRRVQLSSLAAEHVVALPGHELDSLGGLEPDELVLVGSEVALSGQGAQAAAALRGRRALFLTDYANQRGVVEAGLRPAADGLSAWEMLEAASQGGLDALLVFADDPFEFFPALSGRAFARAALTVVVDAVKTRTAAHADVVLPGALLAEKFGTVVNTEGRAQEIVPVAPPAAGATEGSVATHLLRCFDGEADLLPEAPPLPGAGGLEAERPSADYPFLAALDTTLFWNSHALVSATISAWRESRSYFADFPPGCVTLNPDDAHALGVQYASAVTVSSADGSVTLPARLHARMLPGTVWIAMPCWERCGTRLGALAFDPSLRIPTFRPRAVRIGRPRGR